MKILIVEDDLMFRETIKGLVEGLGHDVTEVKNGREAWDLLLQKTFPVIISDRVMPELDGLELCRKVRSRPKEDYTYFILVTARSERESYLEAMKAGVDDFLPKPLNEEQLLTRLHVAERILGSARTIRQLRSLLPACCYCGRIRDENENWMGLEEYIREHTDSDFTHGICPSCMKEYFPSLEEGGDK